MDLYHASIRLPDGFRLPNRVITLKHTKHARGARRDDRYGYIPPISVLDLGQCEPVEVGVLNGKVAKVVVRTSLDDTRDVVLVLVPHDPEPNVWTVKTLWCNLKNDTHETLDHTRYVR